MAVENDYELLERLGEGAFGKVYKARHRRSDDICAVKQIKLGAKSWDEALRSTELQALKSLRHPFIVRLRELIRSNLDGSLYYIFEFIGSDLFRLMRNHPQGLEELQAAELTRQLFSGLAHIHQHNFFHRDIKPENILFDTARETIRIADFGEARSLRARPPFTDYVGTRWYRAPECLLRDRNYSSPVDVWASGLVFAELLRGTAVFCGNSSIDQLYKIFQVLGQPLHDWPDFQRLAEACRFRVPEGRGCGVQRILPRSSKQAQDFVTEILVPNPRRRPLARKLLEHAFFNQCPPLDLERLDTSRSGTSAAAPSEERSYTHRSAVSSRASTATAMPVEEAMPSSTIQEVSVPTGSGSPPRTRPSSALETPAADPPARSSFVEAPPDDLDLDAELDKILGGNAPASPPAARAPAARVTKAPPPPQVPPLLPPAMPLPFAPAVAAKALAGDADTRSTSAGSFKFTPLVREGSQSRDAGSHDGGASPTAAADAPRFAASPGMPDSPKTAGDKSVDALLDSLCADLGVSTCDTAAPEPVVPQTGSELAPCEPPPPADHPASSAGADGPAAGADDDAGGAASRASGSPHALTLGATAAPVDAHAAVAPFSAAQRQQPPPSTQAVEGGSDALPLPSEQSLGGFAGSAQGEAAEMTGGSVGSRVAADEAAELPVPGLESGAGAGHGQALPCEEASRVMPSLADVGDVSNHRRQLDANACAADLERRKGGHGSVVSRAPRLSGCKERTAPRLFDAAEGSARQQLLGDACATSPSWHPAFGGKHDASPWESKVAADYTAEPRRILADEFDGEVVSDTGCLSGAEVAGANTPSHSRRRHTEQHRRAPSGPLPWSSEEASQLRRTVKRVIKRGTRDKEALWAEVSRELGSGRAPKECKNKYASDYRAQKAPGADLASERRRRRSEGHICDSLEVEVAAANCFQSSPRSNA